MKELYYDQYYRIKYIRFIHSHCVHVCVHARTCVCTQALHVMPPILTTFLFLLLQIQITTAPPPPTATITTIPTEDTLAAMTTVQENKRNAHMTNETVLYK